MECKGRLGEKHINFVMTQILEYYVPINNYLFIVCINKHTTASGSVPPATKLMMMIMYVCYSYTQKLGIGTQRIRQKLCTQKI